MMSDMRYRAIRPIPEENLLPGQFVPEDVAKKWIKEELKVGRIAVYKPSLADKDEDDG